MSIWSKDYSLQEISARGKNTMVEFLGIEITEIGDSYLRATMPVNEKTKQPLGLLHGGASVALAESIMSLAGTMVVNYDTHFIVGVEINANHIKGCRDGIVEVTAKPFHLGRSTQVWQAEIKQGEKLVCVSRMTIAVMEKSS